LSSLLFESLMGLEKRLLDDIGGIKVGAQSDVKLQPSQQPQVIAVVLEQARAG
jgi:hypothetical protein